jgi:hypothetical protein
VCICERDLPKTEMACLLLHVLIHFPDLIHRWNHVRNFWTFFGERMMGWVIRFIKNKDLATENILHSYCRQSVLGKVPPQVKKIILRRCNRSDVKLAAKSWFTSCDDALQEKGSLPGSHLVEIKRTRRNTQALPKLPRKLQRVIKRWGKQTGTNLPLPISNTKVHVMTGGVKINGRKFGYGMHCAYDQKNLAGINVGTIIAFYCCYVDSDPVTFAHIYVHQVVSQIENVYTINKRKDKKFIHVESIRDVICIAPHWNRHNQHCAIPVYSSLYMYEHALPTL